MKKNQIPISTKNHYKIPLNPLFSKGETPSPPFVKGRLGGILKWLNNYQMSKSLPVGRQAKFKINLSFAKDPYPWQYSRTL
jgi:hypothetical protein